MAKNKLITIGWVGVKHAYLNISREEAEKRYLESNPEDRRALMEEANFVNEFEFDVEFCVYDAYVC